MSRGNPVWVSRDSGKYDRQVVNAWGRRPEFVRGRFECPGLPEFTVIYDRWRRITGLRLKPGHCKRVRLSVGVLDD